MHLVDGQWRICGMARCACPHPVFVAPAERFGACDHGCGCGRDFSLLCQRIGLEREPDAAFTNDVELVARTFGDARDEQLPDARTMAETHRVAPCIPSIEVADDCDASGIRRPHGEARAAHAVDGHYVCAECLGELEM